MHRVLVFCVCMLCLTGTMRNANAATLLRDPDIENALTQLAKPVLLAAGLSPSRTKILVVKNSSLNAFVFNRDYIFLHSGLILRLKTVEELQAVIAHEAAHIANGHLSTRIQKYRSSRTVAGIGMALAAIAGAAGSGEAATALGLGISSAAQRSYLSHSRAEESSADQSAIRYMVRSGIDPRGMVRVMELFKGQELLVPGRRDPYARSHPMSRDRVRHAKALISTYKRKLPRNSQHNYWFSRAKGKLSAFLRSPKWTRKRAGDSASEDIRLMRIAVAYHRDSNRKKAIQSMARLISKRPNDPYYHELNGQILFESRNIKGAVGAYRKAVSRAPKNALILGSYGRALMVSGRYREALKALENSRSRDFTDARVLRDLAQTYAKLGRNGMASVVTAERYALRGRLKDARIHAKRAADLLPRGSGGWRRAQDVLSVTENAASKRR